MRLGVQYPIHAGGYLATFNASGVADTDWHTLSSDDFYDAQTGDQFAAGLKFAFLEVVSGNTSTISYCKLRAADGAGDGVSNSDGVVPIFSSFRVDAQALIGGASVTSIAFKKAAAGDSFVIYAGLNNP